MSSLPMIKEKSHIGKVCREKALLQLRSGTSAREKAKAIVNLRNMSTKRDSKRKMPTRLGVISTTIFPNPPIAIHQIKYELTG